MIQDCSVSGVDRSLAARCGHRVNSDGTDWAAYRQAVGERVRHGRLHANLTQEALADRSGVGRNTLQRIEHGDPMAPRLGAMWSLARTLGIPVGELLRDDGPG